MKCETPALASVSSREPAPIQKPMATERTLGIRSEMTRSPESSSERTYFCITALSLAGQARRLAESGNALPARLEQAVDELADLAVGRAPRPCGFSEEPSSAWDREMDRRGFGRSYPTQKGFPSGSRITVNVMFVPTFVSTTDAPAS